MFFLYGRRGEIYFRRVRRGILLVLGFLGCRTCEIRFVFFGESCGGSSCGKAGLVFFRVE